MYIKPTPLLAAVFAGLLALPAGAAAPQTAQVTVLFTHDLHSHFLPTPSDEGSYGGYARLTTAIAQQKSAHPGAVLVDGGDFSMGSLFQSAYADEALELRAMGAMGYDATTFGNHEYDYRATGLASMLNAAVSSGGALPALVECNYLPPAPDSADYSTDAKAVWDAFDSYGVADYTLLERDGVYYAIFGMTGVDSDECAPMSGMVLHDPVQSAQATVDAATADCVAQYGVEPLVICLSHSGTDNAGGGEDAALAKAVDGIDVIVSGHTHSTLTEPLVVEDTFIVSAGEYGRNLGVLTLDVNNGVCSLADYELVPIDDSIPHDAAMAAWIEDAKTSVEQSYLTNFNLGYDEVLATNPYKFDTVDEVYLQHESTLGNLLSDAYAWAAEQATGQAPDVALTASGVIRESFAVGDVTTADVFSVASLGIGADGLAGYPLLEVYLTGKDLKTAMEIDASVAPLMPAANLYCSGLEYAFNTNRMLFNKITQTALRRPDGSTEQIVDDKLYRVVTGLYCGQMLGAVEGSSFGLLSVTARTADGEPVDMNHLENYILHDQTGAEVKEWYAVASYLQSMGGQISEKYAAPDGRKTVYASWNPVELLKNANRFTFILIAVVVLVVLLVLLVVRGVRRLLRRKAR